jgi:hypothetical protein
MPVRIRQLKPERQRAAIPLLRIRWLCVGRVRKGCFLRLPAARTPSVCKDKTAGWGSRFTLLNSHGKQGVKAEPQT